MGQGRRARRKARCFGTNNDTADTTLNEPMGRSYAIQGEREIVAWRWRVSVCMQTKEGGTQIGSEDMVVVDEARGLKEFEEGSKVNQ